MLNCARQNYTIDDSEWDTPALSLSPGWNMIQLNGDNEYINATQVAAMTPLLGHFWNSSISWATNKGCSNTLSFIGTFPNRILPSPRRRLTFD